MTQAPWQLDKHRAHLAMGDLSGAADLLAPDEGLQLRWRGNALRGLAVGLPRITESHAASVLDAWVRGGDLVATYAQREGRRTRGQVYWRAHHYEHEGRSFPAIDLIASVQTSLLDSDPTLDVRTRVAAREVLRLAGIGSGRTNLAEWRDSEPLRISDANEIACFIFRLGDGQSSYVEMVHPTDFKESVLMALPDGTMELSNRLFHGRLEKGVILRSRIRAIFLPSERDAFLASACYADFATSEHPLTV